MLTPKKKYTTEVKSVSSFDVYENYFGHQTYSVSPGTNSYVSQIIQLPSPTSKTNRKNNFMEYQQLLEKYEKQKKLLCRKRSKICFLKKQLIKKQKQDKINTYSFINKTNFFSKNSKSLVTMQLLHKKRKPWLQNEKILAISIFYKSPTAYKFMRKNNIILPGVSTLHAWLKSFQYMPGFIPEYMTQMKIMCNTMSFQEKKCVIMIDEMAIKYCLEYNKSLDMIEGYEDLGHLGRSNRLAKLAFVIMIRGLYNKWKLPMSYFLSSTGVKGEEMAKIMKSCVSELIKIGFDPVCITCDQGSANRKMFSILNATSDKPYTIIEGKKIYLIYDVPHLLKSIRNNLLNGNILLKFSKCVKTIRFYDFKKTYEIDKSSVTTRAMCKIGEQHINPNPWQKMSCKIAIQTFSNSVSAAIKTCVATGQLDSITALDTANFFSGLNDLFDTLNSKNLFDKNPNRRPMCKNNLNAINIIKNSINTFKIAEKQSFKNSSKIIKKNVPPCFTGMIWSLNAVLDLYETEQSEMLFASPSTNFFLMTNRLCQDPIENLFSIFRQKGGYNKNPTCRTLRYSFASVCSFGLLNCASEKSNCEEDDDIFLVSSQTPINDDIENHSQQNMESYNKSSNLIEDNDSTSEEEPDNESRTILEKCSTIYYAGYLAKKCLDKFQCDQCQTFLLKPCKDLNDKQQLLIVNKTFKDIDLNASSGLKAPSEDLVQFVSICLNVFKHSYNQLKSEKYLVNKLMTQANNCIPEKVVQPVCAKHFEYIMRLLFIVKVFKECKWFSKPPERNTTSQKPNPKLSILQHL